MKGDEASEGLRLKDGVINTDSGGGVRGWSDFTGRSETGFPPCRKAKMYRQRTSGSSSVTRSAEGHCLKTWNPVE